MHSFESALGAVESAASNAESAAKNLTRAYAELKRAAAIGDLGAMRKAKDSIERRLEQVRTESLLAAEAWPLSAYQDEEYLRSSFEPELAELANARRLTVQRVDGRLIVGSSIIRVLPERLLVSIDSKPLKKFRPSVVIRLIESKGAGKPLHAPQSFIEILRRTYGDLIGPGDHGRAKTLRQIWESLTRLPAIRKQYGLPDFVKDLHFLNVSGITQSKDGSAIRFIGPSTASKDGKGLVFYSPAGERFDYYAIEFGRPAT
jgi:hypothetical protein